MGTQEALSYANYTKQTPPPYIFADTLAATERTTLEDLARAPYLKALIDSWKRYDLGALIEVVLHPAAYLLVDYIKKGTPVHVVPDWPSQAMDKAIVRGHHK